MAKRAPLLLLSILALVVSSCEPGPHSANGFRLPPNGSPERGKTAFLALGCHNCHQVSGVDLPGPTVQPAVPVVLGGPVSTAMTDGYLVSSIIYPSYALAPYPRPQITAGGQSRMPHFTENITVQQLTDIVAFLQTRYVVRRITPEYGYR